MTYKMELSEAALKKNSYLWKRIKLEYTATNSCQAANEFGRALYADFEDLGDDGIFEETVTVNGEQFVVTAHRYDYDIEIL